MDAIIFGIINSSQPLKLKEALLEKLCNAAAVNGNRDVCHSSLKACLLVLYPEEECNDLARDSVLQDKIDLVFKSWVENNLDFTMEFVQNFAMNTSVLKLEKPWKKCRHIRMLNHILKYAKNFTSDSLSLFRCNLKEYLITEFLQIDNLELLSCFSEIYLQNFYAVENLAFDFKLQMIDLIIKLASTISFPSLDENEVKESIIITGNGPVLLLFKNCINVDDNVMKYAAGLIFEAICNGSLEPSKNLAYFLVNLNCDILRENLEKSLFSIPDLSVASILVRLIDWLSVVDSQLDQWIMIVVEFLVNNGTSNILIPVIISKVNQVCNLICNPKFRKQAITVVTFMLMSCNKTPVLFHRFCLAFPSLLSQLKKDESESALQGLRTLVELIFTLIYKFPGYDQIYDPLIPILRGHEKPSDDNIKLWLSNFGNSFVYGESLIGMENIETGIKNLGNTCYINSVIQALFNLPFVKEMVFSIPCMKLSHPILTCLQNVFAFLHLSKRSCIEPREFVQISRPVWFHVGSQQDCSEYLKYLLDKLQQECSEEASKIDDLFNGEINATVECLNCHSCSHQKEMFNDLPLSFNDKCDNRKNSICQSTSLKGGDSSDILNSKKVRFQLEDAKENAKSSIDTDNNMIDPSAMSQNSDLSIIDLLNSYFTPEVLQETNQYLCDVCASLQDAYKSMKVRKFPRYLVLTLKRFTFNIYTKQRSKILDVINYPDKFTICSGCDSCYQILGACENSMRAFSSITECQSSKTYRISSVVVHSGLTSDSGHYYCYSCRYIGNEHSWYLMNDEEVKPVSTNCISNLALHSPRDTPYVIIYEECSSSSELSNQANLPQHLIDMVFTDNQLFLQERLPKRNKFQKSTVLKNRNSNNEDDDKDHGSAGPCSSSGRNSWSGGRFVC